MSKGFNKENLKKLFKFEWRDLIWVVFFIFLLLSIYGYKKDIEVCRDVLINPCEYCYAQLSNQNIQNITTFGTDFKPLFNFTIYGNYT